MIHSSSSSGSRDWGAILSAGEAQRLAVARSILRTPLLVSTITLHHSPFTSSLTHCTSMSL